MAKGDVKAGGAFVELSVKGMPAVQASFASFGQGMQKLGAGIAAAGAAIVGPMVAAVSHFTAVGSAIDDVAQRTKMAGTEIAQLKYAAEQSGASLEDLEKALLNMKRQGISETFDQAAARIAAIKDPTEQVAVAMETWGKSGAKLIPMIANLQQLKQMAREAGVGLSEEDIGLARDLDDAFTAVKQQVSQIAMVVGAALAPPLIKAATAAAGVLKVVTAWANENRQIIITAAAIGAALVAAGAAIAGVGAVLGTVGLAIGGIATALPVLAAIAAPLAVAVAAALALVATIALVAYGLHRMGITAEMVFEKIKALWDRLPAALRGLLIATTMGTQALLVAGEAAVKSSAAFQQFQQAIARINEEMRTLNEGMEGVGDSAASMARSIDRAFERRRRLVEEFATPEERAAKKEAEIFGAMAEVNRNRVLGFISEEQAAAEQRALNIALARHRLAEAERRKAEADRRRGLAIPDVKAPKLPEIGAAFGERPSMVAGGAAAAIALTFGGVGRDREMPTVKELRELRKESVRHHVELVRELRRPRSILGP
jgi:hypothetical protein